MHMELEGDSIVPSTDYEEPIVTGVYEEPVAAGVYEEPIEAGASDKCAPLDSEMYVNPGDLEVCDYTEEVYAVPVLRLTTKREGN